MAYTVAAFCQASLILLVTFQAANRWLQYNLLASDIRHYLLKIYIYIALFKSVKGVIK